MSDWRQILREHDPGRERMDADTAARIRDVVVAAATASAPPRAAWTMRLALAGFACAVTMLSVLGTRQPVDLEPVAPVPDAARIAAPERRQIQFATPGGTRIIWELNPNFKLMESLP